MKARDDKVAKLSSKAQDLYKGIQDLVKDDTISKKEELEQIQKLVDAADKDVSHLKLFSSFWCKDKSKNVDKFRSLTS